MRTKQKETTIKQTQEKTAQALNLNDNNYR